MKGPVFHSYDSLDSGILEEVSIASRKISDLEWVDIIGNDISRYFESEGPNPPEEIRRVDLTGINESLVVGIVDFEKAHMEAAGITRLPLVGSLRIPYVLLDSAKNVETLGHECIHVQQFLHPVPPGISVRNRELMFDHSIDRASELRAEADGVDAGIQCLIEICCYQTWTELEAHRFTPGRTDSAGCLIDRVAFGVQPFGLIESFTLCIRDSGTADRMVQQFSDYCDEITRQVAWVSDLVEDLETGSLFSAIQRSSEELDPFLLPDDALDDEQDWPETDTDF